MLLGCASPAPVLLLARPRLRNVLLPVNTFIFNCCCRAGAGRGEQQLVGSGCLPGRAVNSPGGQSDSDVSIWAIALRQPLCGKGVCSGLEAGSGLAVVGSHWSPCLPQSCSGGCTRVWSVGASLQLMVCMLSPSCATPGRGAFWGEGEASWGEGEVSGQGCLLLTP